jgi:hypothetical protein
MVPSQLALLDTLDTDDPEPYRVAGEALVDALAHPQGLDGWSPEQRYELFDKLVNQKSCSERPLIFHHMVASRLDKLAAKRLIQEMRPFLEDSIPREPTTNFVIFLLIARPNLEGINQAEITRLHLERFEDFAPADRALIYNTIFKGNSLGQTGNELLDHYWLTDRIFENPKIQPSHLLFFEWLAGRDYIQNSRHLVDFLARRLGREELVEDEDLRATRSLLLRHWQEDSTLTKEAISGWQLGPEFCDLLSSNAGRQLHTAQPGKRPASLQASIGHFVTSLAKSLAYSHLSFLRPKRRKTRLAVMVSGQLRGYRQALRTWNRHFLSETDCDFFVHTWQEIGCAEAHPTRYILPFCGHRFPEVYRRVARRQGYRSVKERYPVLFHKLSACGETCTQDLRELYDTEHVVVEDDRSEKFVEFSNQQKMHYKIFAAFQLAQQSGNEYDLYLRIRPDLETHLRAFDWSDLAEFCCTAPVLFTEQPQGVSYGSLLMGDQFALGGRKAMEVYARAWESYPRLAEMDLAETPRQFKGHASLAQVCWLQRVRVERAAVKFGRLRDPAHLDSKDILEALLQDSQGRHDRADQELISAAQEDCLFNYKLEG